MTRQGNQPPAIVLGGDLNALGVVRSLAAAGIPALVLDSSPFHAALWSRCARARVVRSLCGRPLIEALLKLKMELHGRPVLIMTHEFAVETISEAREEIEPHFRVSLPAREMVRTLSDKGLFQSLARSLNLPIPSGVVVEAASEARLLRELALPIVLKPIERGGIDAGLVPRAVRCETLAEAETACLNYLAHNCRVIAQEWVEGPDSEIVFCLFYADEQSRLSARFTGRKIASCPPAIGSTAICAPEADTAAEIEDIAQRFVRATHYRGLGGLELKRDARSGRLQIIEPTVGRTDMQGEIATLAGVNLPALAWRMELGLPTDLIDANKQEIAWRLSAAHRFPETLRERKIRVFDGYWRLHDPAPAAFYYVLEQLKRRFVHIRQTPARVPAINASREKALADL